MSERHVTACIDGSAYSQAVCDAAAWASLRLDIGLTFVHVIDKAGRAAESDVSGQIGLGSREHLLACPALGGGSDRSRDRWMGFLRSVHDD